MHTPTARRSRTTEGSSPPPSGTDAALVSGRDAPAVAGRGRDADRNEDRRRRDEEECRDRWDALAEREAREAYAVSSRLRTPAEDWRERSLSAIVDVADGYGVDRSAVVSATFALFDRYFSRGRVKAGEWSLALFACLHIAVKIHSRNGRIALDAAALSRECGGRFAVDEILRMERRICDDLDWYLNPPTPEMFVEILEPLLVSRRVNDHVEDDVRIPLGMRNELVAQSKLLCELSVMDREFVSVRPSSIAYAAVSVALDIMRFPVAASKWFESLPIERDPAEANRYAQRLHSICDEKGHRPTKVFVYSTERTSRQGTSARQKENSDPPPRSESPTNVESLEQSSSVQSCQEGRERQNHRYLTKEEKNTLGKYS